MNIDLKVKATHKTNFVSFINFEFIHFVNSMCNKLTITLLTIHLQLIQN